MLVKRIKSFSLIALPRLSQGVGGSTEWAKFQKTVMQNNQMNRDENVFSEMFVPGRLSSDMLGLEMACECFFIFHDPFL